MSAGQQIEGSPNLSAEVESADLIKGADINTLAKRRSAASQMNQEQLGGLWGDLLGLIPSELIWSV